MDKANATGIAGMIVGAGIAVAALTIPWEITLSLRHVLFWFGGVGVALAGVLWMLHIHCLYKYKRKIYIGVPLVTMLLVISAAAISEWPASDDSKPGIGVFSVIRLYDSPEYRRRYVYEFITSNGAKAAFFLSSSGTFTFSVIDVHGESYPIEIKVGRFGIPIDQFIILTCEAGIGRKATVLTVSVNRKEIARREIPVPVDLGTRDWHAGSLGAPVTGQNQGGIFLLAEVITWPTTFSNTEIEKLVENAREYYKISLE
jgi:hypothetical protein